MTAIDAIDKLVGSLLLNKISDLNDDDPIRSWFKPDEAAGGSQTDTSPTMTADDLENTSTKAIRQTCIQARENVIQSQSYEGLETGAISLPIEIHGRCDADATGSLTDFDGHKTVNRGPFDELSEHTVEATRCGKRQRVEQGTRIFLHVQQHIYIFGWQTTLPFDPENELYKKNQQVTPYLYHTLDLGRPSPSLPVRTI